jgi:hypothetical protein
MTTSRIWSTAVLISVFVVAPATAVTQNASGPAVTRSSASGQIEGDLCLVSQSGEIKRGAANEVVLLRAPIDLAARFTELCAAQRAKFRQANEADSIAREQITDASAKIQAIDATIERIRAGAKQSRVEHIALIKSAAFRTAPTGMNAHYAFENVAPGSYILFATMPLGDEMHSWFLPVTVTTGSQVKQDLDNNNRYSPSWNCDTGLPVR